MLPNGRAWLFSLRCFAAAVIAMYIAFWADLPRPYWALATVYIASQPLSGATRSKAVFRLLGTLLGAAAAIAMVPNLVDEPALLSIAMAAWLGLCLYFSLLDRTPRSYVFMLAGYSAAIIGFPAVTTPDQIFNIASARVQEISLGIICATIVHSLFFPAPVAPAVADRIAEALRAAQRWADAALPGESDPETVHQQRASIASVAGELDLMESFLAWDPTQSVRTGNAVHQFRLRLLLMMPVISSIRDRVTALRRIGPVPAEIVRLLAALRAWLSGDPAGLAETGATLRQEIDAVEARLGADADWPRILTANLLLRLRDLTQLWQDGWQMERHIRAPDRVPATVIYPSDAGAGAIRRTDRGMALWSAVAAGLALLVCCACWILDAWPDGAVAAEMLAVTCSFFATRDDPAPMIVGFLKWSAVGLAVDFVLLFFVLPMVHDFAVLVLVLAGPLILGGVLMAVPATAFPAMATVVMGASLLSLDAFYDADFVAFMNGGIALVVGMGMAAVLTAITRSVGADWSARRLMRKTWKALAAAALHRGHHDRSTFAARMLDGFSLVMPRLADSDDVNNAAASALLSDLRVGLNIVDLRRSRHELPGPARDAIDAMLDQLAAYFSARSAGRAVSPEPLIANVDAALACIATLPDSARRRDALLGLVGVRATLCPDAAPYRPVEPPPSITERLAA
jgi:uncharacterized membrane protein YccC